MRLGSGAAHSAWTAEDDAEPSPALEKGFASIGCATPIWIGDQDVLRGHAKNDNVMVFQKRVLYHRQDGLARGKVFKFSEITEIAFQFVGRVERAQTTAKHIGGRADGGAGVRRDCDLTFAGPEPEVTQGSDCRRRSAGVVGALHTDAVRVEAGLETGQLPVITR